MKILSTALIEGTAFMLALSFGALPCAAQTVTSPQCKHQYKMDVIPQLFILNNLRSTGATLSVDGASPLSIASRHYCVVVIADGSGPHTFVINSADGKQAQGRFDLDGAARTDASTANAPHDEICTFEDDGLECASKRGWSPASK